MKIVSWNVNGIRACCKKGLISFLQKENPDIFCIQETKAHPHQMPSESTQEIKKMGYNQIYWSVSDVSGYSGVALYSKTKPRFVESCMGIYKFDREGRFLSAGYKDFVLLNIYFPNGSAQESRHLFKQEFLKKLKYFLEKQMIQKKELVVVGDYNIAYLDIDVFDPQTLSSHSGFLPEERQWFQEFLDIGFIDSYRYLHPDKKDIYTWWSYREGARRQNKGWRIDHICITQGLKKRLKKASILSEEKSSDHCPVAIEMA